MQLFCLWYVWRNIQGYEMRTAIRDVAEGMDMGLETGSVPGFSCSLYGGVDFEEDYREVTGWSAVGKEAIPADVDMGKTTRTCNAEGAGEPSPQPEPLFMPYPDMKRGSWTILFLVAHALRRSQFSPSESIFPSVTRAFGAFFRQKISPYGNFLPETGGKTRRSAGTAEL